MGYWTYRKPTVPDEAPIEPERDDYETEEEYQEAYDAYVEADEALGDYYEYLDREREERMLRDEEDRDRW